MYMPRARICERVEIREMEPYKKKSDASLCSFMY